MREGTPAASTRCDVTLAELESELEALLVEYESLSRAWPKEPHAVARAEIGRKVDDALAAHRRTAIRHRHFPRENLGRRRGKAPAPRCSP